jgi:LPXTG-site transpeptidase (sortase) family protein
VSECLWARVTGVRKRLGLSLCLAGGLTVSFAGGRYALGAIQADNARELWEQDAARRVVAQSRADAVHRTVAGKIVAGAPVARVVAPKIGLDAIVLEGVSDDELNGGPGHFPGSALPGDPGNAVISAHRDRHFNHLDALQVGDTVVTETDTRRTTWVVGNRRVIDKNAPALFRTTDATLTLTTCWPMRYVGSAPDRLIITLKPANASS